MFTTHSLPGRRRASGVSLIEVLVAALVAAVFSLGVLSAILPALDLSQKDYEHSRALELAEEQLETAIKSGQTAEDFALLVSTPLAYCAADNFFVFERAVTDLSTGLKRVTVRVYYAAPGGGAPAIDTGKTNQGWIISQTTLVYSL